MSPGNGTAASQPRPRSLGFLVAAVMPRPRREMHVPRPVLPSGGVPGVFPVGQGTGVPRCGLAAQPGVLGTLRRGNMECKVPLVELGRRGRHFCFE
ncbi:hypothetical protein E2C01_075209 [Portunus trituberculatus]|uniref:Uncharacterized protein n=1 Tax=Portunus trituberculatus TaxID=210409 RepID=A0A5B7IF88_PORTR|nr:hypothetical protein [Portunus trituberculatus]